jgi:hypothetical protein
MCWLPVEILELIIEHLLGPRHSFSRIKALCMASRQLRAIAFRQLFRNLTILDTKQWKGLIAFKAYARYTRCLLLIRRRVVLTNAYMHPYIRRTLISTAAALSVQPVLLSLFHQLRTISLCFASATMKNFKIIFDALFKTLPVLPLLTSFTLIHLPRIDIDMLRLCSSRFPSLRTLRLSCVEKLDYTCCWEDLEESSSLVIHSPIPDYFSSVNELAVRVSPTPSVANFLEYRTAPIHLY